MQESIDETSKSEYDVKLKTDFGGLAMLAYKDRSKEELLELKRTRISKGKGTGTAA